MCDVDDSSNYIMYIQISTLYYNYVHVHLGSCTESASSVDNVHRVREMTVVNVCTVRTKSNLEDPGNRRHALSTNVHMCNKVLYAQLLPSMHMHIFGGGPIMHDQRKKMVVSPTLVSTVSTYTTLDMKVHHIVHICVCVINCQYIRIMGNLLTDAIVTGRTACSTAVKEDCNEGLPSLIEPQLSTTLIVHR